MIFITSDLHFGHSGIIQYCNRPFKDKIEMDFKLKEEWNTKISKEDTVYFLGDFAFYSWKNTKEILENLNGQIKIILGNHDYKVLGKLERSGMMPNHVNILGHYYELKIPKMRHIIMSHYPLESWNGQHNAKSIHFHGHSHGKLKTTQLNRFDVGWDVEQKIYTLDELLLKVKNQNGNI